MTEDNIQNKNLKKMKKDILYHLALDTETHDLKAMFGDVKFVLTGGSGTRMFAIAKLLLTELNISLPTGAGLIDISRDSDRYSLYKVGPVICVSHGMGIPSLSILLHEITKLVNYAGIGCKDVTFMRLGTSGGLGVDPGSVVISDGCVDGGFKSKQQLNILGKPKERDAILSSDLVEELKQIGSEFKDFKTVSGKTMCTNDFYEEQGRMDGAICEFTDEENKKFLQKAREEGICNIEMESLGFAAFCHHMGIRAAVVCVTLLDRLCGDQITPSKEDLIQWQDRPALIAAKFIRKQLKL